MEVEVSMAALTVVSISAVPPKSNTLVTLPAASTSLILHTIALADTRSSCSPIPL